MKPFPLSSKAVLVLYPGLGAAAVALLCVPVTQSAEGSGNGPNDAGSMDFRSLKRLENSHFDEKQLSQEERAKLVIKLQLTAGALFRKRQFEEAYRLLRLAFKLSQEEGVKHALANAMLNTRRYGELVQLVEHHLRLPAKEQTEMRKRDFLVLGAQGAAALGDLKLALKFALQSDGDTDSKIACLAAPIKTNQLMTLLQQSISSAKTNKEKSTLLAMLGQLCSSRNPGLALRYVTEANQLDSNGETRTLLVSAYLQNHDYDNAQRILAQCELSLRELTNRQKQKLSLLCREIANRQLHSKQYEDASDWAKRAMRFDENDNFCKLIYARALGALGHTDTANSILSGLINDPTLCRTALFERGSLNLAMGNRSAAASDLEALQRKSPGMTMKEMKQHCLHTYSRDIREVISAMSTSRSDHTAKLRLADIDRELALTNDPSKRAKLLIEKGNVEIKLYSFRQALSHADEAIAIAMENMEAHALRASALLGLGKYEQAQAERKKVIALFEKQQRYGDAR